MAFRDFERETVARSLVMAAAVAIVFSIAVAQILMGLAIVAVAYAGLPVRWPYAWPLGAFFGGTLVAIALSPDPRGGWPQVKKFFVFLMLPLLATTLRGTGDACRLLYGLLGAGVLSSLWSFVQFGRRWQEAQALHVDFYRHYVAQRTTGFMSHWQTFGGQMMMLLAVALALWLFAPARHRRWIAGALAVIGVALLLNETRGNWIGAAVGVVYLVARARPRQIWVLPLAFAALMVVPPVRERALSIVQPHGELDSNQHRKVTWRTGVEMVRAHPWFGLGPEQVQKQFDRYVPADIPRPLPEGWYGHLHNNYLQYAADRGIPTALCLCWLLGAMVWAWWGQTAMAGPEARAVLEGAIAVWLGVTVSGFLEWNLANTEILHLFLVTSAAAAAVSLRRPELAGRAV